MRLFEGTEFDRPLRCEVCEELEEDCTCPAPAPVLTPPEKQIARVGVEKRKKGKLITVVRDLRDEHSHLPDLLTTLKNHCGAGGTVKEGIIEIQGDQSQRVCEKLKTLGYRVKQK